jgi:hypothetical protein
VAEILISDPERIHAMSFAMDPVDTSLVIGMARRTGLLNNVKVEITGVAESRVTFRPPLSPTVARSIGEIAALHIEELAEMGEGPSILAPAA